MLEECETLGVSGVQNRITSGFYSDDNRAFAERWLAQKETDAAARDRAEALFASQAANVLADDANRLASEANRLASRANKVSAIAAIIATVAIVVAIIALFKGHP